MAIVLIAETGSVVVVESEGNGRMCLTLPKVLIIRLERVPFMDITGIQTLEDVMTKLRKRGVIVMLCGANPRVLAKLQTAGLFSNGSPASHCESLREALLRAGVGPAGLLPAQQ